MWGGSVKLAFFSQSLLAFVSIIALFLNHSCPFLLHLQWRLQVGAMATPTAHPRFLVLVRSQHPRYIWRFVTEVPSSCNLSLFSIHPPSSLSYRSHPAPMSSPLPPLLTCPPISLPPVFTFISISRPPLLPSAPPQPSSPSYFRCMIHGSSAMTETWIFYKDQI